MDISARGLFALDELQRSFDRFDTAARSGIIGQGDVALVPDGQDASIDPAQVFDDPWRGSVVTLGVDFDVFDGAGDGGRRDGRISFNDLATVAFDETGTYSTEQRAAARYMLDNLDQFHRLDVAAKGGDGDGLVSLDDVHAASAWESPPPSALPPSPDLNGDGVLDATEQRIAAMQYAPVLYLDPDDGYLLTDPDEFIAGSTVVTQDGTVVDDPQAHLEAHPEATLIVLPASVDNPEPDASKTYYLYDEATNSITYFYFYPNNDGPQGGAGLGDLQDHEGDWERVTVQLGDDFTPTTLYLSSHGGSSAMPWEQVVKQDGQPVVFVATGSHANVFLPGSYPSEAPVPWIANDRTVQHPADALRFDTRSTALVDIEEQWWYQHGDRIHWGEQRSLPLILIPTAGAPIVIRSDTVDGSISGPTGPNPGTKNTLAPRP